MRRPFAVLNWFSWEGLPSLLSRGENRRGRVQVQHCCLGGVQLKNRSLPADTGVCEGRYAWWVCQLADSVQAWCWSHAVHEGCIWGSERDPGNRLLEHRQCQRVPQRSSHEISEDCRIGDHRNDAAALNLQVCCCWDRCLHCVRYVIPQAWLLVATGRFGTVFSCSCCCYGALLITSFFFLLFRLLCLLPNVSFLCCPFYLSAQLCIWKGVWKLRICVHVCALDSGAFALVCRSVDKSPSQYTRFRCQNLEETVSWDVRYKLRLYELFFCSQWRAPLPAEDHVGANLVSAMFFLLFPCVHAVKCWKALDYACHKEIVHFFHTVWRTAFFFIIQPTCPAKQTFCW